MGTPLVVLRMRVGVRSKGGSPLVRSLGASRCLRAVGVGPLSHTPIEGGMPRAPSGGFGTALGGMLPPHAATTVEVALRRITMAEPLLSHTLVDAASARPGRRRAGREPAVAPAEGWIARWLDTTSELARL